MKLDKNILNAKIFRPIFNRSRLVVISICTLLIVLGSIGLLQRHQTTHGGDLSKSLDADTIHTNQHGPVDETPIGTSENYEVSANVVKRIIIPKISVDGYVQKMGINSDGEMAVPSNIHMAGWFTNSAKPGDPGLSIIDGHVHGKYKPGIFMNLQKLKPGDAVIIEFGNKASKKFIVRDVQAYSVKEAADKLYSQHEDAESQLNLITCGGDFDTDSQEYKQRIIVTAAYLPI